jgi:hypothetical protein
VLKEVSERWRERKNAKTQRNFGHGGQGTAEQQRLSHPSVGGAQNLRKGRHSTNHASAVSQETLRMAAETAKPRAHAVWQDDQDRQRSGESLDAPTQMRECQQRRKPEQHFESESADLGRKPGNCRRRLKEAAAKWRERPRTIGRKRSQPFSAPVRNGIPQEPGQRV